MSKTPEPRMEEARNALEGRDFDRARELCRALIDEDVDAANAHLIYGISILNEGRHEEAGEYFMGCGLDLPEIYINASQAFQRIGDIEREMGALKKLLPFRATRYMAAYRRLGEWAYNQKAYRTAHDALLIVFEENADDASVTQMLGQTCQKLNRYKEAIAFFFKTMEADSEMAPWMNASIGACYKDIGDQSSAIHHFTKAYEGARNTSAASNLIMQLQYSYEVSFKRFYNQCREYSARFSRPLRRFVHDPARLDPMKVQTGLRIGFMSGDFVAHSLTHLMLEPFRALKTIGSQHKYYIYFSRDKTDEKTESYREVVDEWRDVHDVSDKEVADMIRADEIDILVDLAGHTAYNRLPVFGYKPAPVQCGWISGMMTPPGLETINYFFTDPWIRPEVATEVCAEHLINLPSTCTYFPFNNPPDVMPLPMDRNGFVTFGSFNNPCKISENVLKVWAASMRAVPRSRMHIKVYGEDHKRSINKTMSKLGIENSRLTFVGMLPRGEDVMNYYTREIDIVLDTWPCAGMLTSAEAMWMGTPVMTLVGQTFLHRQTWTLLNQTNLDEQFGAFNESEFVRKVKDICGKQSELREIRKTLRGRMEQAPLRNALAVAEGLVNGFAEMWEHWCKTRAPVRALEALARG